MMADEYPTCEAGVARVKITPDLPCSLAGYFHERQAVRVRDDIYANVMALKTADTCIVLVSCDLIAMTDEVADPAREAIRARFGVPPDNVLVCATHTHTAPEIRNYTVAANPGYPEKLTQWIIEGVETALTHTFEATVHAGSAEARGFSFNRLYRLKSGMEAFGRSAGGDKVIGYAGPVDPSVQTLAVFDTSKRLRGVAVNFACHPDIVGGGKADFVSADWPGEVAGNMAALYGDDVVALVLQGTAGDINQSDYLPHYMPNGGELKTRQMGRAVCGAAILAIEGSEPIAPLTLGAACEEVEVPYYTRTPEFMAHIEALKAKGDAATYFEKNQIKKAEAWPNDGKTCSFRIQAFRVGDVGIVGMPGEIFTAFGLETKRYSPFGHTLFAELASCENGLAGYKCTNDQAQRGAYGAMPTLSRRHHHDAGRLMTESAIRSLHKLWDGEESG